MARYIWDIHLGKPDHDVFYLMNDFLQKNGFTMKSHNNEYAYCAGEPAKTDCKYLKWFYVDGKLHLEAWYVSSSGEEQPSEGLSGDGENAAYREQLAQLIAVLQGSPAPPNTDIANVPAPLPVPSPDDAKDYSTFAIVSLVLGIISILSCYNFVLCLICAITGILLAKDGCHSSQASLAEIGRICSIIGIAMMVMYFIVTVAFMLFPLFLAIFYH